ncbi:uncharacterized protein LOC100376408 [Saccoglossus kowalevskii]
MDAWIAFKLFVLVLVCCGEVTESTGYIGCRFSDSLCDKGEVCGEDNLFGSCSSSSYVDHYYQLDGRGYQTLRNTLSRLLDENYTWSDTYTQLDIASKEVRVLINKIQNNPQALSLLSDDEMNELKSMVEEIMMELREEIEMEEKVDKSEDLDTEENAESELEEEKGLESYDELVYEVLPDEEVGENLAEVYVEPQQVKKSNLESTGPFPSPSYSPEEADTTENEESEGGTDVTGEAESSLAEEDPLSAAQVENKVEDLLINPDYTFVTTAERLTPEKGLRFVEELANIIGIPQSSFSDIR